MYRESILNLRTSGKSYKEISEILGCCISTISYYLSDRQRCSAKVRRGKYTDTREKYRQYRGSIKERNRAVVTSYLSGKCCVDCGNTDPRVLDFDHVRGEKVGNVSHDVRNAWPVRKLLEEIGKCEIRCANCHRIVTFERRKSRILERK